MSTADLLLEIGTEELPPKSLQNLGETLAHEFTLALNANNLKFADIEAFYTPRRLGLIVKNLATTQADTQQLRKGPAVQAGLDADGNPTKALQGFAKSCKVEVNKLEKIETDKGAWFGYTIKTKGRPTTELVADMLQGALDKLPIAKRMRWGEHTEDFVRPVHWLLAIFAGKVVPFSMFGIASGNLTYGHRFHHNQAIKINKVNEYITKLKKAYVIADFKQRKAIIEKQLLAEAKKLGATVKIDENLLNEVTSLVEYPVAVTGNFDKDFLQVPPEAIITFMQDHQKFFALFNKDDELLPNFITISNIKSKDEKVVREGNERVIRPRLADALFFWQQDKASGLETMRQGLSLVVYQDKLGSVQDKVQRVAKLAAYLADKIGTDSKLTAQAARLGKADLLSGMVGEFPKLQGIMGRYYALAADEPSEVALAIEEQYLPKFSGDKIPSSDIGKVLALADRIDTLLGIFGIGLEPSGDKDPFALRRAAIGVLRIIKEGKLELDIKQVLTYGAGLLKPMIADGTTDKVVEFILERYKRLSLDEGGKADVFDAVKAVALFDILDFGAREHAVEEFLQSDSADSLAQANKRIDNLLKKSKTKMNGKLDTNLFEEQAEFVLYDKFNAVKDTASKQLASADYSAALDILATLREPIDDYFDKVMIMCEDKNLRQNRLALLGAVRDLFLQIADISKLQVS